MKPSLGEGCVEGGSGCRGEGPPPPSLDRPAGHFNFKKKNLLAARAYPLHPSVLRLLLSADNLFAQDEGLNYPRGGRPPPSRRGPDSGARPSGLQSTIGSRPARSQFKLRPRLVFIYNLFSHLSSLPATQGWLVVAVLAPCG